MIASHQIERVEAGLYRYNSVEYPSVTKVLEPLQDFSRVNRLTLAAAAQFGAHVHQAVNYYNRGTLDEERLAAPLAPYLAAWKRFLTETDAVVVASEKPVLSSRFGYAGTPDCIIQMPKYLLLPDVKSTSVQPATVGPQTAAYAKAYSEMFGTAPRRACILLRPDGTYRLDVRQDSTDWSIFLSCLNIYKWQQRFLQ